MNFKHTPANNAWYQKLENTFAPTDEIATAALIVIGVACFAAAFSRSHAAKAFFVAYLLSP